MASSPGTFSGSASITPTAPFTESLDVNENLAPFFSPQSNPSQINTPNFLTVVAPGNWQRNGVSATIHINSLNELINQTSTLNISKDRVDRYEGTTNSTQYGGEVASYGDPTLPISQQDQEFVFSTVYEGRFDLHQTAAQTQNVAERSEDYEFGNRSVTRLANDTTTVHGDLRKWTVGTKNTNLNGDTSFTFVRGTKHTKFSQVKYLNATGVLSFLLGMGLHLQTRPGPEMNVNIASAVVAWCETLFGIANISGFLNFIQLETFKSMKSWATFRARMVDLRVAGVLLGKPRA